MSEHRMIMETLLERELRADENVHHRNGVRDDNRPENLELWATSQLSGQRVIDLVAWARVVLDRYAGEEAVLRAAEVASNDPAAPAQEVDSEGGT